MVQSIMAKFYIAYGSNLNIAQMRIRCPHARFIGVSELRNYRLAFKGHSHGAFLTIEHYEGGRVPVVVWAVSNGDIKMLNQYEGYPDFYYTEEMEVPVDGRMLNAFVYIMAGKRHFGLPSDMYFETCLDGYKDFHLDENILWDAYALSKEECSMRKLPRR